MSTLPPADEQHPGRFGAAISCMDGRCVEPVLYWLKGRHGLQYVDMITEPGIIKLLTAGSRREIQSVRRRLEVSVQRHGAVHCVVVGHHNCAGDPLPREEQERQILDSVALVASWGLHVSLEGLYINELWQAEEVCHGEG